MQRRLQALLFGNLPMFDHGKVSHKLNGDCSLVIYW